jgi:hypothetical protein
MIRLRRDGAYPPDNDYCHSDVELTATNFAHPNFTSGQHTNGAATIWIRTLGGEWRCTGEKAMHKVRAMLADGSLDHLLERDGAL